MKSFELNEIYQFNFPTKIHFGLNSRVLVAKVLKEQNLSHPMVVTDRGLAATPIPQLIVDSLQQSGLKAAVFSEIWGNPTVAQVYKGVVAFREHQADSIVALGGGAAVDVAKAIALMIHHPGELFDYEDGKPGARPIEQKIPFLAALPTTAGTGSEVGRSTVISDDKTKIKKIIFSPRLLPQVVFADPNLTKELPPSITAATGMDALTHLVEAYLALGFQPLCDGIALEGLKLVQESLVNCVRHGDQLQDRAMMLMASLMGAVAFQKGLGVTHSCAHALSTVCDLHHGLANGILIPYTMRFNLDVTQEKLTTLAKTVGTKKGDASSFIDWLVDLKQTIKVPKHLGEVGVKKEHLPTLVEIALADVCHSLNPKKVAKADFEKLFAEALGS